MLFKRPSVYFYNEDTLKFFERNGLTLDDVDMMSVNDREIIEPKDVDSSLEVAALYDEESAGIVSIADVLGYDSPLRKDLFESISEFFDSNGDGYHSRSVGMMEYSSDEVVSKLNQSFNIEPIKVKEVAEGKYFIDANGMHRFTILRAHYLFDKNRGLLSEEELKRKYEISVITKKLDRVKTYCAFLLKIVDSNLYISSDLDDSYRKTGKIRIVDDKTNDKRILSDEELIFYTTEVLMSRGLDVSILWKMAKYVENNQSLSDFLMNYFNQLYNEIARFIEFKNSITNFFDISEFQISEEFKEKKESWSL